MEEKKDKKVHTQLFTFFLHLPVTFGTDAPMTSCCTWFLSSDPTFPSRK